MMGISNRDDNRSYGAAPCRGSHSYHEYLPVLADFGRELLVSKTLPGTRAAITALKGKPRQTFDARRSRTFLTAQHVMCI